MVKILIVGIILSTHFQLSAQFSEKQDFGGKRMVFLSSGIYLDLTRPSTSLDLKTGLGYLKFTKRAFYHSFEINKIGFQHGPRSTFNATLHEFDLSPRYEFGKNLQSNNKLIVPRIGAGMVPYFIYNYFTPNRGFRTSTWNFVNYLEIIPHLLFDINNQVKCDLSAPLKILSTYYRIQRVDNPSIPISQQTYAGWEKTDWFPRIFELRLALIVDLTKPKEK